MHNEIPQKPLDEGCIFVIYLISDVTGLFLCLKFFSDIKKKVMVKSHENRTNRNTKYYMEVKPVRVKITLACTECKQRNYDTTKEKRNHPDRMETKKYCRFCRKHTMHKETK